MDIVVSISLGGTVRGSKTVSTPCVIGRSKEVTLPVSHPVMSRNHCELFEEGGKLYLKDNSSLNGTQYKGEYIDDPILFPIGGEFAVGEIVFKVTLPVRDSQATPAKPKSETKLSDRPTVEMKFPEDSGVSHAQTIIEPRPVPKQPNQQPAAKQTTEPQKPAEPKPTKKKSASAADVKININLQ